MPRLILDCTHLHRAPEMNTGIERVVRRVAEAALARSDGDGSIALAALDSKRVVRSLPRVPAITDPRNAPLGPALVFEPGDVYFVLSSSWGVGLLECLAPWRRMGVVVGVLFYDVLPLEHPEFFDERIVVAPFRVWVDQCAANADFFACISESTRRALVRELASRGPFDESITASFMLGNDPIGPHTGSSRAAPASPALRAAFGAGPTYLTVATIEPRKNHARLLEAFEQLWTEGADVVWLCVGRKGSSELVERLKTHPEWQSRLFLADDADDEDLALAYARSRALVCPSITEGFGLPLVEALAFGCPVLASDIAVFREVVGDAATYFDPMSAASMARAIDETLRGSRREVTPPRAVTWDESTGELLAAIDRLVPLARERAHERLGIAFEAERALVRKSRPTSLLASLAIAAKRGIVGHAIRIRTTARRVRRKVREAVR